MEGAWKLRVPVRLVETNQSSVSSREDCVTQLLVNFQLKTKPIDNVSAFCLLNSIICSCLLLDKNNHFSIGAALHGDTYDSFFESETHERHRCWPAALQARPASVWCFQQSVYQPVTAELEADGKRRRTFLFVASLVIATGNVTNLEKLDSFQLQGEISAATRIARISEEMLRCANLN